MALAKNIWVRVLILPALVVSDGMAMASSPGIDIVFQSTKGGQHCNLAPARLVFGWSLRLEGKAHIETRAAIGDESNLLGQPPRRTSGVPAEVRLRDGTVRIQFEFEDGVRIEMLGDTDNGPDTLRGTWHRQHAQVAKGTWVGRVEP